MSKPKVSYTYGENDDVFYSEPEVGEEFVVGDEWCECIRYWESDCQ